MDLTKDIVENAARIAVVAHGTQKRKGSDCPYVVHPFMVALDLARRGFADPVIAAALAHDVLEDTDFPPEELKKAIGDEAFSIVQTVSHDNGLTWDDKKKGYIEAIRNGSDDAKAVSTADKIHNANSLLAGYEQKGPAMWNDFSTGKEKKLWFEQAMLQMLQETWKHPLVDEYAVLVEKMNDLA